MIILLLLKGIALIQKGNALIRTLI